MPGVGGWAAVLGFAVVALAAVYVVHPVAGAVTGAITLVALAVAAWATSPVVEVDADELRAGRARIPVRFLGEPEELDRAGVARATGPGFDARTYCCLRTWTGHAVWLTVHDPQDPTPAWLVSTRHPGALAAAVRAAQGRG